MWQFLKRFWSWLTTPMKAARARAKERRKDRERFKHLPIIPLPELLLELERKIVVGAHEGTEDCIFVGDYPRPDDPEGWRTAHARQESVFRLHLITRDRYREHAPSRREGLVIRKLGYRDWQIWFRDGEIIEAEQLLSFTSPFHPIKQKINLYDLGREDLDAIWKMRRLMLETTKKPAHLPACA